VRDVAGAGSTASLGSAMPDDEERPICGIVMPISAADGCTEAHWSEVLEIITDVAERAGFEANLVSNADDVGIIQKRIIQNLYDNPIVVCDVSGKNPNVMFELGIRLAFDKPTVIIKDDKTAYSFDTAPIEHIEYPRDLRFSKIVEFKQRLQEKISSTHRRAKSDERFTTFLKHFGEFKVVNLDKKEISGQDFIIEELRSVRTALRRLELRNYTARSARTGDGQVLDYCLNGVDPSEIEFVMGKLDNWPGTRSVMLRDIGRHKHIVVRLNEEMDAEQIKAGLDEVIPHRASRIRRGSSSSRGQDGAKQVVEKRNSTQDM
jgi:hypothetical protein